MGLSLNNYWLSPYLEFNEKELEIFELYRSKINLAYFAVRFKHQMQN